MKASKLVSAVTAAALALGSVGAIAQPRGDQPRQYQDDRRGPPNRADQPRRPDARIAARNTGATTATAATLARDIVPARHRTRAARARRRTPMPAAAAQARATTSTAARGCPPTTGPSTTW